MPWTEQTLQEPFITKSKSLYPDPRYGGIWLGANPVLPRQHRMVLPETVRQVLPDTRRLYWGRHQKAGQRAVIAPYKHTLETLSWCTCEGRCQVMYDRVLSVPEERFSTGETIHFVSTFHRLDEHHLIFLVSDSVLRRSLQERVRTQLLPPRSVKQSTGSFWGEILHKKHDREDINYLLGLKDDPVAAALADLRISYLIRIICQLPLTELENRAYDPDMSYMERLASLADPRGAYPEALVPEGEVLDLANILCFPVEDLPRKKPTPPRLLPE